MDLLPGRAPHGGGLAHLIVPPTPTVQPTRKYGASNFLELELGLFSGMHR